MAASRFFLGNEGSPFYLDGVFACGIFVKNSLGTWATLHPPCVTTAYPH